MKVACIAASQIPSSTANSIQVMKACHGLAQAGAEVRLWAPAGGETAPWERLAGHYGLETPFEVRWLLTRRVWRRYDLAWSALKAARSWGAELIYTWVPQAAALAGQRGLPVALELHDHPTGQIGPQLFRLFLRGGGKKRLLVITHALRRMLEREYGELLAAAEIQIAPNGVELSRYTGLPSPEEARRQLDLSVGETVVFSGHFYAGRGMDLLLGLARAFPRTQFLWVGGRPEDAASWQARLRAGGIENVRLTGFIENRRLPLYQAAGDVLLMPYERAIAGSSGGDSAAICSPMKMFEYLAAGRAILSSDLPVLHEVLNDQNAVFCPPEDLAAWSQALAGLLNDPERRRRLGEQARRDAQAYTWRARAERALAGL